MAEPCSTVHLQDDIVASEIHFGIEEFEAPSDGLQKPTTSSDHTVQRHIKLIFSTRVPSSLWEHVDSDDDIDVKRRPSFAASYRKVVSPEQSSSEAASNSSRDSSPKRRKCVPCMLHPSSSHQTSFDLAQQSDPCTEKDLGQNSIQQISIQHHASTPLRSVGLQLWRGALLMADWLIFASKFSLFTRSIPFSSDSSIHPVFNSVQEQQLWTQQQPLTALELGGGVGVTALIADCTRRFQMYFMTDYDDEILEYSLNNLNANVKNSAHEVSTGQTCSSIQLRQLDLKKLQMFDDHPSNASTSCNSNISKSSMFSWKQSDQQHLDSVSMIIGADVIYDDEVTAGVIPFLLEYFRPESISSSSSGDTMVQNFLAPLPHACEPSAPSSRLSFGRRAGFRIAYFSIERRYVFTMHHSEAMVAPALEYFLQELRNHGLAVSLIDVELVPQFVQYQRTPELIILRVTD